MADSLKDAPVTEEWLSVTGVTKAFQGQTALSDVSLSIRKGEVHCLLGQNGSGKSTLIKILAGFYTPDEVGSAEVRGQQFAAGNPDAAHDAGLRFIHQDLALIDGMTVAENLSLGQPYPNRFWLSDRKQRRFARDAFQQYGVEIDVDANVGSLGAAQRTMTTIVRALRFGNAADGLLVLDEATASLSEHDKVHLFSLLKDVKSKGGTILYVTHRLHEVFEIGDRVTVLRNGRGVGTEEVARLDHDGLVKLILGRSPDAVFPAPPVPGTEPVLIVEDLAGGEVERLSLTVHRGEIVGIVGLASSGVQDAAKLIYGAKPRTAGTVRLLGERLRASPAAAVRAGLSFVPSDRKRLGGMPTWSLSENITLPSPPSRGPLRWVTKRRENRSTLPLIQRFSITPSDPDSRFANLSGGNQQKAIISRWIHSGAKVFVLEDPTAGVDIGAKAAIYDALKEVAQAGAAVVMVTSDFEEAAATCDRVFVLRGGRVGAVLHGDEATTDSLLSEAIRDDVPGVTPSARKLT